MGSMVKGVKASMTRLKPPDSASPSTPVVGDKPTYPAKKFTRKLPNAMGM